MKRARLGDDAGPARGRRGVRLCIVALAWLALGVAYPAAEASACNAFLHDGSQCPGSNAGCHGFCSFNENNQQVCFFFPGNSCDDGNASTVSDQCDNSGNCSGILCGNGVQDGGESCDDGVANGTSTSCCSSSCTFQPSSTACDDGDASTVADRCDGAGTCAGSLCGNGASDGAEDCDDGAANGTSTSCCTASCTFKSASTACDDGDASTGNDQCDGAGVCAGGPCGNGTSDSGEDCDDGAANGSSTSCCSTSCTFQPASTACDDSDASTVGDQCDGAGTCAGSLCGNGASDAGEDCDDGVGNGTTTSCCTTSCTFKASKTACDDGNASTAGDQCDGAGTCAGSLCGNGASDAGEDCDDGAANGTVTSCCSASCTFNSASTACDDGNASTLNDKCDASGVCGGDTELVANGDFEGGSTGGIADSWLTKRLVIPPDTVDCGSSCYAEFHGNKSLKKYYQLCATPGSAGDSFTLTARSKARNVPGAVRPYAVEATILHVDGSTQRFRLSFSAGTHGYETQTTDFTASENYDKIKITIMYGKARGTVRFDDVSLLRH